MKAVITGATGAIGMALIHNLIRHGNSVLVLCRADSPRSMRIPDHPLVTKMNCSLAQMAEFSLPQSEPYDVFFHFAWEGTTGEARNDMMLQNANVRHTLEAVELAKRLGCRSFIGAGSQAEYGRVEGRLTPDMPAFPENGYGMAKLCAGQMSRVLCETLGLRHIWVRILSVYGPYDGYGSMVMSTLRKFRNGEMPCFTPGEQVWDYLYSEDAAAALTALAEKGRHGNIYCLGSGEPRPLKEYILAIRDAVAPDAPVGLGKIPYAPKQIMHLCADITALQSDTGFAPKISFEEGIRKTATWFAEEEKAGR